MKDGRSFFSVRTAESATPYAPATPKAGAPRISTADRGCKPFDAAAFHMAFIGKERLLDYSVCSGFLRPTRGVAVSFTQIAS